MQQLGLGHPSAGQMCHLVKIKPAEKALPSGHSKVCSPVTARMLWGQRQLHPGVMCRVCATFSLCGRAPVMPMECAAVPMVPVVNVSVPWLSNLPQLPLQCQPV